MAGMGFKVRTVLTLMVIVVTLRFAHGQPISSIALPIESSGNAIGNGTKNFTPMHKVLMTQRGYIQFLRWELPVPEIEEFTFCLWVKSTNLTYPHSIFSYSKNEKDRLVRSWISSYGKTIHLEINNVEIFVVASAIEEHRWYHICESWDNKDGRFAMWINGRKQIDDYATKMSGHVIPSKGDIVVGQEYTDFDKGLEDGIEGAVLGFNLVLASAFDRISHQYDRNRLDDSEFDDQTDFATAYETELPTRNYGTRNYRRTVNDRSSSISVKTRGVRTDPNRGNLRNKRITIFSNDRRTNGSTGLRFGEKSVGQRLVELSFENCQLGRGSPRIGDELMIVSWTRTPVRVFGGAVVKNARNYCGQF